MRHALAIVAAAMLLAAPVLAAAPDRLIVTHMGAELTQPLHAGDIVLGITFFDGVDIQPKRGPTVCGPGLGLGLGLGPAELVG